MNADNNFTPLQAKKAGFDRTEYAPAAEGLFTGTLMMKIYGDFCLRCYFLTDDGRKLMLTAWQNRRTGRYGLPQRLSARGSGVDFKETPPGTRWENRVEQSRTGKLSWTDAKELT